MFDRGENGISLLGITGYAIIEVDGKYVMVEMLLSAVPFGDVKHTGDAILRASKQQLAGYGVGQYECSFTSTGTEIVLLMRLANKSDKTAVRQMRLANESDKTGVRVSPSQPQVDQLEG